MADAAKAAREEKERRKAEVRARLEAAAAGKKGKKGFMTPARKKKLRTLLRKIASEEVKKEQQRKAEERRTTIASRCGPQKSTEGINEAGLQAICREYYKRIGTLEDAKYDLEYAIRQKDYVINELSIKVNDHLRGKFVKPVLKKVSKFEYGKFEKLMRAAKKADNDFRANLKSVGPSTKYKLDEDVKEAKPEWAAGVKEGKKGEE